MADNNVGNINETQDQTKPDNGTKTGTVLSNVRVLSVDRSPKDIRKWRSAIMSAENVYYPVQQQLYDLYTDILLDGHLAGIIDKRIDTVLNKDLFFETKTPEGWEKEDEMDAVINSDSFRRMLRDLLWTQMFGRSGFEFIPGKEFAWKPIPRKHIKMKTQKITFEQTGLTDGVDYTQYWNIWITGQSDDLGLLASVAQYALLKRGMQGDWAQYIELFGMPAWIFKYDAYDEQTKAALDKLIDNIGSALRIRVPKQADVEAVDAKSSNGNGDLQDKFRNAMNAEMSIRILGNTETTSSSKGSGYAQSKTHGEQQLEITKSDIAYLRNLLNSTQFIAIMKSYALPVENGRFAFGRETDILFMKEKFVIDQGLIMAGLPVGVKYLYDTYSIPAPEPGEEIAIPLVIQSQAPPDDDEDDDPEPTPVPGNDKPNRPSAFFQGVRSFFAHARR